MSVRWLAVFVVALIAAAPARAADREAAHPTASDPAGIEFFESKVRPVLVEQCYQCHSASAEKLKGGLLLDNRDAALKGGDTGPAVVPGDVGKSLLIKAVTHDAEADLAMPPKKPKLPGGVIADLTAWVKRGAPWPADKAAGPAAADDRPEPQKARREHWAFQPLRKPAAPTVKDVGWARTPVDAFVLSKLEQGGLRPAPPADPRTLLRRVYLDLIGLPPTPEEQKAFADNPSPEALSKVVDDLLARPQYGERWGRHWLDVVRYAETQGYERDEPKPFTWRYRDYVIKSFNDDKPYDRFLTEQLAGDEVENYNAETQVATTFLRLGTFDTIAADAKLARYDTMDDVVGTTTAAFLGQTLRCARCHNHKFEPLSQADYYRVLAVFDPLKDPNAKPSLVGNDEELKEHHEATAKFDAEMAPVQAEHDAFRIKVLERLGAGYYSDKDPKEQRDEKKPRISKELLAAFKKPTGERSKAEQEQVERGRRKFAEELKRLASREEKAEDERLQKQVDAVNAKRPTGSLAYVFTEAGPKPPATRLFIRGDCNKPGDEVQVAIPALWQWTDETLPPPSPTERTSGRRLWLAKWMTGPGHPLVARVMANRIWQYHFGRGIVATSNDFGLHGEPPTHPELLDWLAAELVDGGWKIKRLHKTIVLSSVYQTASAHDSLADADPENKLLRHWRTRRLEAEAVRDSILAVSGRLNPDMFGPPIYPPLAQKVVGDSAGADWGQSDERQASRRSVYVFQKRSIMLPELEIMGMPDSSTSSEARTVSTTALQSLLLLNSRFASEQAGHLAERVEREAGDDRKAQVERVFELALCRPPRPEELEASLQFIAGPPEKKESKASPLAAFCLVMLNTNEFIYTN